MAKPQEVIEHLKKLDPNEEIACLWVTKIDVKNTLYNEKMSKKTIDLILKELNLNFHEPSFAPEDIYVDYDSIIQKAYDYVKGHMEELKDGYRYL